MSKGSTPRPRSVAQEEYDKRWDAIFGRDLHESEPELTQPVSVLDPTKEFGYIDTSLTNLKT